MSTSITDSQRAYVYAAQRVRSAQRQRLILQIQRTGTGQISGYTLVAVSQSVIVAAQLHLGAADAESIKLQRRGITRHDDRTSPCRSNAYPCSQTVDSGFQGIAATSAEGYTALRCIYLSGTNLLIGSNADAAALFTSNSEAGI